MKVAYFINQYPKVSHSFIRREIQALERLGVEVLRYALRGSRENLADEYDQIEFDKTRYVLRQPVYLVALYTLRNILLNPMGFAGALILAVRVGWRSDRGLLRHMAYLIEACVILRWCLQDGIEHLHAHFGTNSSVVAMLAKKLGGASYSFTIHASEEFDQPHFVRLRETVGLASFVVAVSSFGRSQIYLWTDFRDWPKVKIVRCGLDREFHAGRVAESGESLRIVCVGRLCEQKGHLLLIEATGALIGEGIDFELVLVGDGELRPQIEQLISDYDLVERVTITGWVSSKRVREEIEKSRAFVLPSFAEGLPVVIMEAMALKRPAISTYIAGIPELITPGENGWLVPAGDADALAAAMREALTMSLAQLGEMGAQARERVLERHDIDREATKLMQYFEDAIDPHGAEKPNPR